MAVSNGKPDGYTFGRPTTNTPDMRDKVGEWGAMGKSRAWMCAQLVIGTSTLAVWEAENENFREALSRAKAKAHAHWEDQGHANLTGREFQASVWSRSMAARFPDDWRESTKTDTNITGGIAVTVTTGVPRDE